MTYADGHNFREDDLGVVLVIRCFIFSSVPLHSPVFDGRTVMTSRRQHSIDELTRLSIERVARRN